FSFGDGDVARAPDMFQTLANSIGAGPDWRWDLALLTPAVMQSLATLEQQAMARLGIARGTIERITISKDKTFHPRNDKVLIEIGVSGGGKQSEAVAFDFTGGIPKLDVPASGIFVGQPGGSQRARDQ